MDFYPFCLLAPSLEPVTVTAHRRGSSRCGPVTCAVPGGERYRRWWPVRQPGAQ